MCVEARPGEGHVENVGASLQLTPPEAALHFDEVQAIPCCTAKEGLLLEIGAYVSGHICAILDHQAREKASLLRVVCVQSIS